MNGNRGIQILDVGTKDYMGTVINGTKLVKGDECIPGALGNGGQQLDNGMQDVVQVLGCMVRGRIDTIDNRATTDLWFVHLEQNIKDSGMTKVFGLAQLEQGGCQFRLSSCG